VGEATAFGGQVPVAGAVVDQQAALFAEGCLAPGEAKCTYGTGAFLLVTAGRTPCRSRTGLVSCVAWQLSDATTYCLDGQVFTAGSAASWLQDVGLIASPADLDGLGGQVRAPEGVVFVPGLAGLGAPYWRPRARGAFLGISLGTTRAHLVRSFLEGVAAAVTWLARAVAMDLGAPLTRLRADGGLTRSHLLMQAQADLLQAPVEVYPSPNATALGAAALARLGMGWVSEPKHAALTWKPVAVYEPAVSANDAEARLDAWRAAAEATMDLPG
jgi:glycerol kinase